MIRSLSYSQDGQLKTGLDLDQIPAALSDTAGLLWVDFEGTPPEEDEPVLLNIFGFHPLAVDDALQESHIPKVDDWEDYLYIVLHAIQYAEHQHAEHQNAEHQDAEHDIEEIKTLELDVFLGRSYIVTHHDHPIPAVDQLWTLLENNGRHLQRGPDHLLYRLIDAMVANYVPVVEKLDLLLDQTEDQVFIRPTQMSLEKIFAIKHAILDIRRLLGPQREVLNRLARDEYQVIGPKDRVYFRDIYDHLVRLYDIVENLRDMTTSVVDTYLSVTNNRMNDIMKTLTIISTLFLPLTFVVSFFGMNFFASPRPLDEWVQRPVFYFTLALLVLTPLSMYLWVRRRGWM